MKPPAFVLDQIERMAGCSPCAKSKRAAIVYDPVTRKQWGCGYNTLPKPMACDGSEACRRDCAKICLHAESMAIQAALVHHTAANGAGPDGVGQLAGLEMLHVKVVDGQVVPGGPPSCWQCSREILEHELAGFWLYERADALGCCETPNCITKPTHVETFYGRWRWFCDQHVPMSGHYEDCPEPCATNVARMSPTPTWRYYTAEEFHRATLVNCGLHVGDLPVATHVLWGGRALCDAQYLRGAPGSWPKGQTWVGLNAVRAVNGLTAEAAARDLALVTCRVCRLAVALWDELERVLPAHEYP